jgi:hypothetical protein
MKKLLLFAVGAMMATTSFAQEEDVTHLIKNAGFDEDLTFQVDGTMKEKVSEQSLSERSWAYIAADNTVYARPKSTSSQNRSDGRKMEAVNGFKGQIQGWTLESNADFPKCEWTYFGSVPYDLGETAVPIADDGTTYLVVPARPANGEFEPGTGFIYLRAGWAGKALYKQEVELPCAKYRLEYWTININPNTQYTVTDLTQVTCRKDVFKDDDATLMQAQEWTKHEFIFTPTARFTMQFGYEAANKGSGGMPIVALDGIKLYRIADADPEELIDALINECVELSGEAVSLNYEGLSGQIDDYQYELGEIDVNDVETAAKAIDAADAIMENFRAALKETANVDAALVRMEKYLSTTDYPGKADFEAAYRKILGYKENSFTGKENFVELIFGAAEEAQAAILAYNKTQVASEENPADYTFMIQHPWFINPEAEPVLVDGQLTFPKQYDENLNDLYSEGSASSADLNSEGWTITGASGGDQRLNWQRGRSCWNAWNNNFTTTIAVGQTITGLPNGYYTVAADMLTQSGYANGSQKVYAESTAERKTSSQFLTSDDWDGLAWETISMTPEEKVLVVDNTLTIGAEGTGDGNAASGWFLVTNFKLFYLGEADANAVKGAFDNKVAAAKELAESMNFKADKKALNDSIAKYEAFTDYIQALAGLNIAMNEAQTSQAKYEEYFEESKTLPTIEMTLSENGGDGYGFGEPIVKFAYDFSMNWINGEEGTYNKIDSIVNLTKNYVNTYVPAYNEADVLALASKETGKNALYGLMETQKNLLLSEMQQAAVVDSLVADLKKVSDAVRKQNIYDNGDTSDFTAFIQNPNAEAETGWTFERGNGDKNTTSGQWYDGSNTRYFDSYHAMETVTDEESGETSTVPYTGLKNFKFSQLIEGLPNGTYTVGAKVRTPAEGAYVFVAPAADTTFVEIPVIKYIGEETEYVEVIASDRFGPIWEAAKAKYESGNYTEEDEAIYRTNIVAETDMAQGRGWQELTIEGVKVENHQLLIGSMTGTEASATQKVFNGAWYSVGGWTLTLTEKGNNDGWSGPLSGVETVKSETAAIEGIYSLTGTKMQKLQRGLNIVVSNGKAMKIIVK